MKSLLGIGKWNENEGVLQKANSKKLLCQMHDYKRYNLDYPGDEQMTSVLQSWWGLSNKANNNVEVEVNHVTYDQ